MYCGIWIVFICNVILLGAMDTYFCLLDDVRVLWGSIRVASDKSTFFFRKRRAFGPCRIYPNVQRDRPRRVSGWWIAAVRSVAREVVNTILRMGGASEYLIAQYQSRTSLTAQQYAHFYVRSATSGRASTRGLPGVGHTTLSLPSVFHSQSKCYCHRPGNLP
jgi:hypothetical protein